jgi:hypothetical protein
MGRNDADRATRLTAVRDALEKAIAECDSKRDLAPLSREYRAVMSELESLGLVKEKRTRGVDEIGRRRAARRSAAEDQDHTSGAGG